MRTFFDGERGGEETTFGQDSTNGPEENAAVRRDGAMHPLLDRGRLHATVTVRGKVEVGGEETDVLELHPASGPPMALHISTRTGLVRQRVGPSETVTFSDYRNVDGEFVPFHVTSEEALGTVSYEVQEVRFNVTVPKDAFEPRQPAR